MLQTRPGRRSAVASVRMAVDMCEENLISKKEAIKKVKPEILNEILVPVFDGQDKKKAISKKRLLTNGLGVKTGATTGRVYFQSSEALAASIKGPVILVCQKTGGEDIEAIEESQAVVTTQGSLTSHAAIVSKSMGKPCITGCSDIEINSQKSKMAIGKKTIKKGDWISIDSSTGEVFEGKIKTLASEIIRVLVDKNIKPGKSEIYQSFVNLISWANEIRKIKIRCSVETEKEALTGLAFGAEGIGILSTEQMFSHGKSQKAIQEMIFAEDQAGREKALAKVLPVLTKDFVDIFKIMRDLPVTVKLFDRSIQDLLPFDKSDIKTLAKTLKMGPAILENKIDSLYESHPLLGHRGARLGISFPELYDLQVRAIIEAAVTVKKRNNIDIKPEILVPFVGNQTELRSIRERSEKIISETLESSDVKIEYMIGTMVDLPSAAIVAEDLAKYADFITFNTDDLTQMTLGISKDDSMEFMGEYLDKGIFKRNPFESIEVESVGKLIKLGVENGRAANKEMIMSISGEQGAESESVKFFNEIGISYVSCDPTLLPAAIISAAQAAIAEGENLVKKSKSKRKAQKDAKQGKSKKKKTKLKSKPLRFPPSVKKAEKEMKKKKDKKKAEKTKAKKKATKKAETKKSVKKKTKKTSEKKQAKKSAPKKKAASKKKTAPKKKAVTNKKKAAKKKAPEKKTAKKKVAKKKPVKKNTSKKKVAKNKKSAKKKK
jgi:pyruvate, orthophosphate dikinase